MTPPPGHQIELRPPVTLNFDLLTRNWSFHVHPVLVPRTVCANWTCNNISSFVYKTYENVRRVYKTMTTDERTGRKHDASCQSRLRRDFHRVTVSQFIVSQNNQLANCKFDESCLPATYSDLVSPFLFQFKICGRTPLVLSPARHFKFTPITLIKWNATKIIQ